MKTYLSILMIILSYTTSFAQTREWKSINAPAHDNCYGLLNYEIQRRPTSSNPELYEARIIFTTGQFDNDFEFSFKGRKEGSWGRITVPATGRKIVELYGTYTLSESIYFDTERLRYLGLELKHLRGEEQYVKCGEGANEVLRRDEAKGKNKAGNTSSEVPNNEKNDTDNGTTENEGYQVIDVDTTAYEAEKTRKKTLAEEQINRRNEETLKEENKAQFKIKQLADAQNFIDNQNKQSANQEKLNQKLADDLTQTFNQISDSWAKEREFQSKMSSLTNIRSEDANSIINEARSKAQQINVEYSNIKDDALNQGVNATQTLINSAQNEKQVIAGAVLGTLGTIASQSNLERERKDAQIKLQNQKEGALQKLSNNIIEKYKPLNKKYEDALIYAVLDSELDFYNAQYNYTKCMVNNAYEIIVNDYSCSQPTFSKPSKKTTYTGNDYYNAYKRKAQSPSPIIKNKAVYFLELAIEAEPNNAEWLYEKTLIRDLSVRTKTSILYKAHNADVNNEKIKTAYENELKKLKEVEKIENLYIDNFLKSNRTKDFDWNKNNNLYFIHIKINSKIKHLALNKKGEIIFRLGDDLMLSQNPLNYQYEKFNNGLLKVKRKNDNQLYDYGFVDSKGKIVIPLKEYNNVGSFYNGYAKVQDAETKLYGFIDTSGNQIVSFEYLDAENFQEGIAAVQETNSNDIINGRFWGFIDNKGNVIIPIKFYKVSPFSDGLAAVKELPNKVKTRFIQSEILSHYIDINGNKVISGNFNYANSFSNGLAVVGDKRNYWYIDKRGNEVFDDKFDMANDFNEDGYALVRKKKHYYFINKKGENETQNKFKGKPTFNIYEGKYNDVLDSNNKLVQIDKNGNILEK